MKRKCRLDNQPLESFMPKAQDDKFIQIYFSDELINNDFIQHSQSQRGIEIEGLPSSRSFNSSDVITYVNEFAQQKYKHKSFKIGKIALEYVKRALKMVTATLSLWVPGMIQYFRFSKSKEPQSYSQIAFGKLKDLSKTPNKVVEMVITKETKTNGLMEDLELVIQLIID